MEIIQDFLQMCLNWRNAIKKSPCFGIAFVSCVVHFKSYLYFISCSCKISFKTVYTLED